MGDPVSAGILVIGMVLVGMGFIIGYFTGVCRAERYWKGKINENDG